MTHPSSGAKTPAIVEVHALVFALFLVEQHSFNRGPFRKRAIPAATYEMMGNSKTKQSTRWDF
jgi:hypothetical protein